MKTFFIVENGELVEYKRIGKCTRCGQCCCNNLITFKGGAYTDTEEGDKENTYDWSDYEGFSVFRSQDMTWYFKASIEEKIKVCAYLDDNKCTIWMQDDFPAICRYWPIHPNDLKGFPDCGFKFEKVEQCLNTQP